MTFMTWLDIALGATGVIGVLGLGIAYLRSSLGSATIKLLQDNKDAQDAAIKRLQENDAEKATQISNLSGQVQVLKDIPLAQIAKSLEVVNQMQEFLKAHQANTKILVEQAASEAASKVINYMQEQK